MNMILKTTNNILRIMLLIVFKYITAWALILHILYYLGIFKKYQYSLLMISILISICGGFITYIYPKKIPLPMINTKIDGYLLNIFDLMCHHFPLILLLIFYNRKIKNDNLIMALVIIIIYSILNNPLKVYGLTNGLTNGLTK